MYDLHESIEEEDITINSKHHVAAPRTSHPYFSPGFRPFSHCLWYSLCFHSDRAHKTMTFRASISQSGDVKLIELENEGSFNVVIPSNAMNSFR
jgi:hypothetical protein